MSNLKLWDGVSKTAPSATKTANAGGGRQETSINGTYMFMRATDAFGPCGIGWGYEIVEERYDQGQPYFDTEGKLDCYELTHTIKLRLWFKLGDDKGEVFSFGHTRALFRKNDGQMKADGEAPKKSLTDAIKKALSMLGFSADIFMGQWDDREYVEQQLNAEALDKADDKDAEAVKQAKEYAEWKTNNLTAIDKAVSMNELEGLYKAAVRKCKRRGDNSGVLVFQKAAEAAKKRLEAKL